MLYLNLPMSDTPVFTRLKDLLSDHSDGLKVTADEPGKFELYGTKKARVGKKEVEGMYFASAVQRKHYVGFYFFPIYTHPDAFADTPEPLKKCLKGKSCFHIKEENDQLFNQIDSILKKGKKIYQNESWI